MEADPPTRSAFERAEPREGIEVVIFRF